MRLECATTSINCFFFFSIVLVRKGESGNCTMSQEPPLCEDKFFLGRGSSKLHATYSQLLNPFFNKTRNPRRHNAIASTTTVQLRKNYGSEHSKACGKPPTSFRLCRQTNPSHTNSLSETLTSTTFLPVRRMVRYASRR